VTAIIQKDTPNERAIDLVNAGNKVFTFPKDNNLPSYLQNLSVAVTIPYNNVGAFTDTFKCQRFDGLLSRVGPFDEVPNAMMKITQLHQQKTYDYERRWQTL
jgi:hypothetical protein